MKKRFKIILVICSVLIIFISSNVYAHTTELSGGNTDSTCKFQLMSNGAHMGTSSTSFYYTPAIIEFDYSSNVNSASYSWAGYIYVGKNDNSSNYITSQYWSYGTVYAAALAPSTVPHDTSWYIKIYYNYFDALSSTQRSRVLAHEMGHIFGLMHVPYSSVLMYSTYQDPLPSPQTQDKWGIRNCTHSHITHSFTLTENIGSPTHHKVRCSVCNGFYYDTHDFINGECTECGYIE